MGARQRHATLERSQRCDAIPIDGFSCQRAVVMTIPGRLKGAGRATGLRVPLCRLAVASE